MASEDTLLEKARDYLGKEASNTATARDPVNLATIRTWCEAMGETNPIYLDKAAAQAAGHPDIVAPPAMLDVWTMSPFRPGGRLKEEAMEVLEVFDKAGFFGTVATNVHQVYHRYLTLGDVVTDRMLVDDISDMKKTGLGDGYFVTLKHVFTDQKNAVVGEMMFRVLKFRPPEKKGEAEKEAAAAPKKEGMPAGYKHPRPSITHDNAFWWEGLKNRKLLFQSTNGRLRFPPSPMDPVTGSFDFEIVESKGEGAIHSFVVMHQPQLPDFDYPLPILLVELDEGVRIVANVLDAKREDIRIGARVKADFLEVEPGYILPAFRLV